jgi:hypothetical protein
LSRFLDRGAIVAGWIGAGMALVIVIALELVIAIQPLVVIAAMPVGAAIGAYANVRAQRRSPARRVLANALWAGSLTGLTLAVLYVAVRLLFIYADTGVLPDGTRLDCERGPACGYARFVDAGYTQDMAAIGITDAASFEAVIVSELVTYGGVLFGVTVAGALLAGGIQALSGRGRPKPAAEESTA